jgi:serine phosphatase RsbU (regulator of sigma subunit)
LFEEFDNAAMAINEIKWKENDSFKVFIESVEEKNKKAELTKFKKKLFKLEELKEKLDKKKKKVEKEFKEKKISIERESLKKQLKWNISEWKFTEAIFILNNYLEKYNDNLDVINFVNKEKATLNKLIEKNKKIRENEIKKDAFLEARELIWEIQKDIEDKAAWESLFAKFRRSINIYGKIKRKVKEKRLMEEVDILLQQQTEKNEIIARSKLALIHSWVLKEISGEMINGYEMYGKIIWADKISWDTLWFYNTKNNYRFFIGDATGHGIKAWFIITQLTKKISEIINIKSLEKIVFEVNNALKQELKSWNFITSIFFDIDKKNIENINFIGMWHEPMFVFRKKTQTVEKIIPGWLAAGIRIIKDTTSIKKKSIPMEDGDILISYSDGIAEARSPDWQMYSIDRMWKKLEEFAKNPKYEIHDIYNKFIEDLRLFTGWQVNYYDDVSIILIKRDREKEILENDDVVQTMLAQEWLPKTKKIKAKWKTLEEVREEIEKVKKESALKNIIRSLDILYKTWEIPKLKQDAIRYIKEWYIDKKINFYLKKALDNENDFKIKQKNKKIEDKYNVLRELYKKWDYETVIIECSNIITKDGNL